jgi:hypothetical protein
LNGLAAVFTQGAKRVAHRHHPLQLSTYGAKSAAPAVWAFAIFPQKNARGCFTYPQKAR